MNHDGIAIRPDLADARAATVADWAQPGTWWNAAERLAIIGEVRAALDADVQPPPWAKPSETRGGGPLPDPAIDAVWRLTNHPGTLTGQWCEGIVTELGDPFRYVELVGLVAQANTIDRFADALELARPALSDPAPGEPTRVAPDGAAQHGHWVPTVDTRTAEVLKALSAVPAEHSAIMRLNDVHYMPAAAMSDLAGGRNTLDRLQIELIAARTSSLNECFY
ncbi:MAG: alkylhydroperoxidase-related (seleno)protein [Ilumatobacter sp.]